MQLPFCVESWELLSIFCLSGGCQFGFQHGGCGCGSHSPSLGCPRTWLWAIFGFVATTATEHAQVLVEPALVFLWGELHVLFKSLGVLPNFLGVEFNEDGDWVALPDDDLLLSNLPEDLLVELLLVLVLVKVKQPLPYIPNIRHQFLGWWYKACQEYVVYRCNWFWP